MAGRQRHRQGAKLGIGVEGGIGGGGGGGGGGVEVARTAYELVEATLLDTPRKAQYIGLKLCPG